MSVSEVSHPAHRYRRQRYAPPSGFRCGISSSSFFRKVEPFRYLFYRCRPGSDLFPARHVPNPLISASRQSVPTGSRAIVKFTFYADAPAASLRRKNHFQPNSSCPNEDDPGRTSRVQRDSSLVDEPLRERARADDHQERSSPPGLPHPTLLWHHCLYPLPCPDIRSTSRSPTLRFARYSDRRAMQEAPSPAARYFLGTSVANR